MKFQYTLDDGSHFLMSATDMSDLLDVMHGRASLNKERRDAVPVHRANDLVRQLERGLENMEREIELALNEIRERREQREPAEWEPADD